MKNPFKKVKNSFDILNEEHVPIAMHAHLYKYNTYTKERIHIPEVFIFQLTDFTGEPLDRYYAHAIGTQLLVNDTNRQPVPVKELSGLYLKPTNEIIFWSSEKLGTFEINRVIQETLNTLYARACREYTNNILEYRSIQDRFNNTSIDKHDTHLYKKIYLASLDFCGYTKID